MTLHHTIWLTRESILVSWFSAISTGGRGSQPDPAGKVTVLPLAGF